MWQKQSGVQAGDGVGPASVDAAWLSDFPLMKGVRIETLREVTRWFSTEHFVADRVIIQQGEPGETFYILVRGKVDVLRTDGEHTVSVGKLQDGDCFGEMALLSSQPRNATVRALTDCVCPPCRVISSTGCWPTSLNCARIFSNWPWREVPAETGGH